MIDISDNQITGDVPVSLKRLNGALSWFYMKNNPQLSGCVPLSAFTTITVTGTLVVGRCISGSERARVHNQQRSAIRSHFIPAFGLKADEEVMQLLRDVLNDTTNTLGNAVKRGQLSRTFQEVHPSGEGSGKCMITISLLGGIEYVTDIDVKQGGLDMTQLTMLFQSLPKLKTLSCTACNRAPAASQRCPPALPSLVPDLGLIYMPDCGLVGIIPSTYGAFTKLTELWLQENQLSGQLPPELANMASLASIELKNNRLSGEDADSCTLQVLSRVRKRIMLAQHVQSVLRRQVNAFHQIHQIAGTAVKYALTSSCMYLSDSMPGTIPSTWSTLRDIYVGLRENRDITDTIPASFVNSANTFLDVLNTSITGCVLKGVQVYFWTLPFPDGLPTC
jgi:hypothetical protein